MKKAGVFLGLLIVVCVLSSQTDVRGQAGALTVGAVFDGLGKLADKLTENARSLIQQGNNAAAEQQLLLAGMIRNTLEQARKAYADSLRETVDQTGDLEKDAFAKLNGLIDRIDSTKADAVKDVNGLVRDTQSAANQLLSNMPFTKKYPVFEGVRTRDILREIDENPADLEILGFWLVDPDLKKKPLVTIKGGGLKQEQVLPPDSITALFDRMQIQLPNPIKDAIYFANTPCNPRQTFEVKVTVFYNATKGVWPVTWKTEAQWLNTANVLPGSTTYEVTVAIDGTAITKTTKRAPFSAKQDIAWGCATDNHPQVQYSAGAGKAIVGQPTCQFPATGKFENSPTCEAHASGDTAVATGYVRGANTQGVHIPLVGDVANCPGGGGGSLILSGEYQFEASESKTYDNTPLGSTMMVAKNRVEVAIPTGPDALIRKVRVIIHRAVRGQVCPSVHDTIEIAVPQATSGQPGNTVQQVKQTSKYGGFSVTVDKAQVTVERLY